MTDSETPKEPEPETERSSPRTEQTQAPLIVLASVALCLPPQFIITLKVEATVSNGRID